MSIPMREKFTGFVFKIQANMDPQHHDRIAFLRDHIGKVPQGHEALSGARPNARMQVANAITFMARDRDQAENAYPGDIHRPAQPWHHSHRR